jgi:hypothetical protein
MPTISIVIDQYTMFPLREKGATMKFLDVIQEIVEAAGQTARLTQRGERFRLRVENSPFMPLTIEAWDSPIANEGQRISVAHYFEQEGDLVPDPEVEIRDDGWPIELSQRDFYTQVTLYQPDGTMLFAPQSKRDVLSFLNGTWAPNLRVQRFSEAARKLAVPGLEVAA